MRRSVRQRWAKWSARGRDLGLGQVLEVAKCEYRPLAGAEAGQRLPDVESALDPTSVVRGEPGRVVRCVLDELLAEPPSPAPPAHLVVVDHPPHARLGIVDLPPPGRQLGECALDEVLGVVLVTAQHVRRPQQRE